LADHVAPIVRLVSVASGIDERELMDASPVDLLALINPIIKVNADFFRLRLLLAGKLKGAANVPGVGQIP
ncbi:MAG: hypothetical protein ACTS5I_17570, partial [Rhodanobacter sp.]